MTLSLTDELKKLLQGDVSTDPSTLKEYSHDYSIFEVKPQVVVFPKNTDDLKRLVKFVRERKEKGENISLTGRSAGTDMSGGPLNEGVIAGFTKYFNHIKGVSCPPDLSGCYVDVEPGVYYRDLEKELVKQNLMYPSYPASKDLCAVGGIVNNNSGGEKTLAYGQTKDWVERVKIVLEDGEEHEFGPVKEDELKKKMKQKDFEGEIYRKLFKLIDKNYDAIMAAKPKVSKNSTGYLLSEVWNKEKDIFNIAKLITGAQGTLGLVTEARLRLMPIPKHSRLFVIFSRTLDPVPEIVRMLLKYKPESIESYDDRTLQVALKFFPALVRMMKGSIISLGLSFIPEALMVLRGGFPKMVLLVSLTSDDENDLNDRLRAMKTEIKRFPVESRVTRNAAEEEKYWTIRRRSFSLLHSHLKGKEAEAFVDDVIVDPDKMAEFLPKVNAILDRYKDKLIYTIAGHPGNGNFHIIPLADLSDPQTRDIIRTVTEEVYKLTVEYGGSISGEHNDGLIRTPFLPLMYDQNIIKLFAEVKNIFDSQNIFNPRKKVGGDKEYSMSHMKRA